MKPTFFNRWVILGVALLFSVVAFFWTDFVEQTSDSFAQFVATDVGPPVLRDTELGHIKLVKYVPLRNNVDQIRVTNLHVAARAGAIRTLSFDLHNTGTANDYPWLQVTLSSSDGAVGHVVFFSPSEYVHGKAFTDEEIRVDVDLQPGEARADVKPTYQPPRRS